MVKPTPIVYAGIPGHFNAQGINLNGQTLLWGPLSLTNYTIDTWGPGTIWVEYPSYLVNSTLSMESDDTLNVSQMLLVNSHLSVGKLDGYGSVTATNHSTISVSSSDATTGLVALESSTLNITPNSPYTGAVLMDSKSTVNLGTNFTVQAGQAFIIDPLGSSAGTLNTDGMIIFGTMIAGANIKQQTNTLIQGGRLELEGSERGGNINITSGTLEFSPSPQFLGKPETSSENFHSGLAFTAATGTLQFDGLKDLSFAFLQNPAIDHYSHGIAMHDADLVVFSHGAVVGNFQLLPGEQNYSAHEFSVHGNQIVFHQF